MVDEQAPAPESAKATPKRPMSHQQILARQRELESELALARRMESKARRGKGGDALSAEPEEESWLMTYLDMMTLMLVLLVVMLAFAGKGAADSEKQGAGGVLPAGAGILPGASLQVPSPLPTKGGQVDDPFKGLALDQLGEDIDVVVNESTVSFRISSEILFSSGQADLSLEGLSVLKRLVPVLNSVAHRVAVEGHTDSVPIRSSRYPSNWELSGARAGSVVRYLEANGVASSRLRAVGYADTRPLSGNRTAEERASNRRVELIMEAPGS